MAVTQYQQLAEPVYVPPSNFTGRVSTSVARRRRFQYQSYVAPLEPSLFVVQKMDWFYPFSEPVRRELPYPHCQYVEPLVPGLRENLKLDWLVQHPEPVRREIPPAPGEMYGFPQWEARLPEFVTEFGLTPEIPVRRRYVETPWFCTPVVEPSVNAVTPYGWGMVAPELAPRLRRPVPPGECYRVAEPIIPPVLMSDWWNQTAVPVRPKVRPQYQTLAEPLEPSLRVIPPFDWMFTAPEIPVPKRPARYGDYADNKYPLWDVPAEAGCPYEPPDTDDEADQIDTSPDDSTGDYLPPTQEGSDYLPGSIDTCQ